MWKRIDAGEWPKNKKLLIAYKNKLGNWRRICATYYDVGTLSMSEDYDYDDTEVDDDGKNVEPGWFEECENQDYVWPTVCEPLLWSPLPSVSDDDYLQTSSGQ